MKIAALTQHRQVLAFLTENNLTAPVIPAGCNTFYQPLTLTDGRHAVVINQRGFSPTAADNEEECNGLTLFILDESPTEQGRTALLRWVENFITPARN